MKYWISSSVCGRRRNGSGVDPEVLAREIPGNQRLLKHAAHPTLEMTPCPATDRHAGRAKRSGNLQIVADRRVLKDFVWTWTTDLWFAEGAEGIRKASRYGVRHQTSRPPYPKPIKAKPPELSK